MNTCLLIPLMNLILVFVYSLLNIRYIRENELQYNHGIIFDNFCIGNVCAKPLRDKVHPFTFFTPKQAGGKKSALSILSSQIETQKNNAVLKLKKNLVLTYIQIFRNAHAFYNPILQKLHALSSSMQICLCVDAISGLLRWQ